MRQDEVTNKTKQRRAYFEHEKSESVFCLVYSIQFHEHMIPEISILFFMEERRSVFQNSENEKLSVNILVQWPRRAMARFLLFASAASGCSFFCRQRLGGCGSINRLSLGWAGATPSPYTGSNDDGDTAVEIPSPTNVARNI